MPRWSLNPTTSVLTREEKRTQAQRKRPREDGDGDGSEAATSQGASGGSRGRKRQEGSSPRAFRGSSALLTLDFRLLASGSTRESIYVALSHPVYGDL